jgi:ubiquinone/menaquinone biosynthesis C-methylase UbiE
MRDGRTARFRCPLDLATWPNSIREAVQEHIETTIDKFLVRLAADRLYKTSVIAWAQAMRRHKPLLREDSAMRRTVATMLWLGACCVLAVSAATAEESPRDHGPAAYPRGMNKKFTDPNADVQKFVKQFENEGRDVYAKRREVARAVGLHAGDAVADIGAGTGLFTELFAAEVGSKGTVYAVDIGPVFVKYISRQAKRHGLDRIIKTVLNTQDSAELPAGSIDVAFLCDTYHHFEHPAKMLASIHRALRPGGRLVVVDFDLRKDSGDFVKRRARAAKEVYFGEIAAAGFQPVATKSAPKIKDNFYAEFRRIERKPHTTDATSVK